MQTQSKIVTAPKSLGLFQGWYVVGALFCIGFMLYGGGLYSFILFVPPLAKEFHWSSAGTGGLVSAFWLSAPLSLWAAPLIRRFGEKRLVIAGIVIEAISLMMLFSAHSLWQMYLLRAVAGFGKILFAITLPVIISKWFSRHFGLAVAIMFSGWSLGGLGLASLTQYLLSNFGWRETSVALGVAQLAIALPLAFWGLRASSAADLGLNLDGDSTLQPDCGLDDVKQGSAGSSLPYLELLRKLAKHPAFLVIVIASSIYYVAPGGVLVHQVAVIEGSGGTASMAALVLGITAGCGALGAVLGGWIFDKFPLAISALVVFSLLGGGVLCLLVSTQNPSVAFLTLHAVLFGLGAGCGDIFWITLIKRRIPNGLFATAWGIWYFVQLAFNVVAPVCAGAIIDFTKSYPAMLVIELCILAIPFSLALLLASWRAPSLEELATNVA